MLGKDVESATYQGRMKRVRGQGRQVKSWKLEHRFGTETVISSLASIVVKEESNRSSLNRRKQCQIRTCSSAWW